MSTRQKENKTTNATEQDRVRGVMLGLKRKRAAEKLEREKNIDRIKRESVLEDLKQALGLLASARDVTTAIEEDVDGANYFQHQELGRFARLALEAGGSQIEQALCNLGLIEEANYSSFHEPLRRNAAALEYEMPAVGKGATT